MKITSFYYKKTERGICILRCRSLDTAVVIPEEIEGLPVTELGDYVCSETCRTLENGVWDCGKEPEDLPGLWGNRLTELSLPLSVRKIGRYAFYNCEKLEKLSCSTETLDWGAGAFTGCRGIRQLELWEGTGEKSCFQEIISELPQTLWVHYHGKQEARLLFPEFFEESVENTPARILETHIHGCGHQYRYCFKESEFQYRDYDSLFPHVKVQETEETVLELAEARLLWPGGLTEENRRMYLEYLTEHKVMAAVCAIRKKDMERLRWLTGECSYHVQDFRKLLEEAAGDPAVVSYLMNLQHQQLMGACGMKETDAGASGETAEVLGIPVGAPVGASKETAGASGVRKSGRRKFEL